ncbi:hypothetical protein HAV15_012705 [Penicillium sp. str. |nr:hypothetical protein HAV15_012705 [Penicillium sp. str. \
MEGERGSREGDSESKPAHGKSTSNRLISCCLMFSPHSHWGQDRDDAKAISDYISPTRAIGAKTRAVVRDDAARSPKRSDESRVPSFPCTPSAQRTRQAEPFVQPGPDLNPSYEQPSNARPVWSCRFTPRAVRSGMVPTKQEPCRTPANAQRPTENPMTQSRRRRHDDIEQGRIDKTTDPSEDECAGRRCRFGSVRPPEYRCFRAMGTPSDKHVCRAYVVGSGEDALRPGIGSRTTVDLQEGDS